MRMEAAIAGAPLVRPDLPAGQAGHGRGRLPRIVVWQSGDPACPPGQRAVAMFLRRRGMLPLAVYGATPEEARAKAERWWREERPRRAGGGASPGRVGKERENGNA